MSKQSLIFTSILVSGAIVWRISERLSSDAVGLAVGVFLGVLAAVPICFVLMSQNRHREAQNMPDRKRELSPPATPAIVIISQKIDKQVMINQGEAWRISEPLQQVEEDTAYPIEYK